MLTSVTINWSGPFRPVAKACHIKASTMQLNIITLRYNIIMSETVDRSGLCCPAATAWYIYQGELVRIIEYKEV